MGNKIIKNYFYYFFFLELIKFKNFLLSLHFLQIPQIIQA